MSGGSSPCGLIRSGRLLDFVRAPHGTDDTVFVSNDDGNVGESTTNEVERRAPRGARQRLYKRRGMVSPSCGARISGGRASGL